MIRAFAINIRNFYRVNNKRLLISFACFFLLLILYYIFTDNFLLFHTLAELFSIIVACVIFTIAWNLRHRITNNYIIFLGYAYLFKSILQVLHLLSYKGINIFISYPGANLPTQLWISSMYIISISLLIAPFFIDKRLKQPIIVIVYTAVVSFIIASIFVWDIFPVCYVEPAGLTSFKIISEYIISFILILSIITLLRKRELFSKNVLNLILTGIILKITSELSFTSYISVYGFANFLGHILMIVSNYFIYMALISLGLKNPFELIFRGVEDKAKEYIQEIAFIRAVIDNADILVVVYDSNGRILLFNKTCQELTGYNIEEVRDKPYWEYFIRSDEIERIKEIFNDVIEGNLPGRHDNYWTMKNGSLKLISWSKTILTDRDKAYIVAVGRDITQITELERENKNIVSMIAHDMKSPLLSVQLFSSHLLKKRNIIEDKKQDEYLNIIHNEGEKLNKLIDEFLEFLLMHHGLITLDLKKINPLEMLKNIYDIYCVKAGENEIEIKINCSFDEYILGDIIRLNRVLTNLLDNAIKYSDKKSSININAYKADSFLKIEIEDSGIGIAAEDLPAIFNPFIRGGEVQDKSGYGIGLAYVKNVIEKHSGTIIVQSEIGKGSKFTIILPLLKKNSNLTSNNTACVF